MKERRTVRADELPASSQVTASVPRFLRGHARGIQRAGRSGSITPGGVGWAWKGQLLVVARPPESESKPRYELALRDLARCSGSMNKRLRHLIDQEAPGPSDDLGVFAEAARPLRDLPIDDQVRYIWRAVRETIDRISDENPDHGAALRAALRCGSAYEADDDHRGGDQGVTARLKMANDRGDFGKQVSKDTLRRYWTHGVVQLARVLEHRLDQLGAQRESWDLLAFEPGDRGPIAQPATDNPWDTAEPPPAGAQLIAVKSLTATYVMTGRAVSYAISERTVVALEDGVDRYVVRARAPGPGTDEHHRPTIAARLNCRAGPMRILPGGTRGDTHEVAMLFPAPLAKGNELFFASAVTDQVDIEPLVEVGVTSRGIEAGHLKLRIQFDDELPEALWWYSECLEDYRLVRPSAESDRFVPISVLGYAEHTFKQAGRYGHRYGLAWAWSV